jgi:6-phosphogluconolactonase (cycloisomerase 2 family)
MLAYVGCRTTRKRNARGRGLGVFRLERPDGPWQPVQMVEGLVNPSYLAMDRSHRTLYTVHGDQSEVSAFRIDPADGRLTFLNRQSTYGINPVHLVVEAGNRFLLVANYGTGSVVSLPIAGDGSLERVRDLLLLSGETGPHRIGQGFSHPHQILPDPAGTGFIVPDKGLDATFVVELDSVLGTMRADAKKRSAARPGAGPRHAAFHPTAPILYLLNELDSTITTCRSDGTSLTPFEVVSTQPSDFFGANSGAAIAVLPSGRFVYVTNRGHDSVAIFAVDWESHALEAVGWVPTQGTVPRFMTLDPSGEILFVANEGSDTVVSFRVDQATGALTPTGNVLETGSPVCVLFGPAPGEQTR